MTLFVQSFDVLKSASVLAETSFLVVTGCRQRLTDGLWIEAPALTDAAWHVLALEAGGHLAR